MNQKCDYREIVCTAPDIICDQWQGTFCSFDVSKGRNLMEVDCGDQCIKAKGMTFEELRRSSKAPYKLG